jgi:tol-pal system protein YbgF
MRILRKSLFIGLSLITLTSNAALFDDTEARKKILDVEVKMQAKYDAQAAEIEDLKKRLSIQSQGLLDLQSEIELLKQETAQLRGSLEVVNHALGTAEQRQKDLYADTDARIRKLEGGATLGGESSEAPISGELSDPIDETEEVKAYKMAYAYSQEAKHLEAFEAFDTFVKQYPDSKLTPDALYGLGYSQFALKNYKSSIASQNKLITSYPDSPKVPNAMYSIANSHIQLGQVKEAKKMLSELIAKHPNADVIPNAQRRLKVLETIK